MSVLLREEITRIRARVKSDQHNPPCCHLRVRKRSLTATGWQIIRGMTGNAAAGMGGQHLQPLPQEEQQPLLASTSSASLGQGQVYGKEQTSHPAQYFLMASYALAAWAWR